MPFGLQVFHRSATSLQGHVAAAEGAEPFALFNLHVPPLADAHASLHVVDPDALEEDALPPLLRGLHEMMLEQLGVAPASFLVTSATTASAPAVPEALLRVQRHRPTPDSSRDLLVEEVDGRELPVALLERFVEGNDSMNVLVLLDPRYRNESMIPRVMRLFEGAVGTPPPGGRHDLDVLFASFLGEFGAVGEDPEAMGSSTS